MKALIHIIAALAAALPALLGPASPAAAQTADSILDLSRGVQASGGDFLPPDEAFKAEAASDGPDRVRISGQIAPGYYLYRSRMGAKTTADSAQLGTLALPQGVEHTDEFFGTQEVYYQGLEALLPVARPGGG